MFSSYRQHMTTFWAFALLIVSMAWGASAYAITPAGTVITNLATVTYQDSVGNTYTAQSNESAVTVAEIYSADLLDDQTKDGAPGQIVYFPHQLINNGNTADTFTLTVAAKDGKALESEAMTIYLDVNGNGQPDANEPVVANGNTVSVAAGTVQNLVVAAQVPNTATGSLSLTLTANTANNSFENNVPSKMNTDTINIVANGAVLVTTKEVVSHDIEKSQVTYRITVTNNGNKGLLNGAIYDFFPAYVNFDTIVDKTTADARLGEIEITDASTLKSEFVAKPGYLSGSNNSQGLKVDINNLEPRGTASVEFTVGYSIEGAANEGFLFSAGDKMLNKAFIGLEGTVDAWTKVVETNTVSVTLPQVYGVEAHDRTGANHTHDDSVTDTDTDETAPAVGVAEFQVIVKNTGNGADNYTLSVANTSFPKGTTFTFWDEVGISLGTNSGNIPKGEQKIVMIKAQLPADATATTTASNAVFTATSVGDNTKSDTVDLQLNEISNVGVDLAYDANGDGDTNAYSGGATTDDGIKSVVAGTTVIYPPDRA